MAATLFPNDGPLSRPDDDIYDFVDSMIDYGAASGFNPSIDSGWSYFGQFVSHDVSDGAGRTRFLDLDSMYGGGPSGSGSLYVSTVATDPDYGLFRVAVDADPNWRDFARKAGDIAEVADARNDETVMLGQMTIVFLLFHNWLMEELRPRSMTPEERFNLSQRLVRFHYQWLIVNEYLPKVLGRRWDHIWNNGAPVLIFYDAKGPHTDQHGASRPPYCAPLPDEFRLAAYRFGHSMVRPSYVLNEGDVFKQLGALPVASVDPNLTTLRGGRRLAYGWAIQWNLFFAIDGSRPQESRKIDILIARALHEMGLPQMTLEAGNHVLPSGEAVQRRVNANSAGTLPQMPANGSDNPLWWYILNEAQQQGGETLGPVGSKIVGEVLAGLLIGDPNSFCYGYGSGIWRPNDSEVPVGTDDPVGNPNRFTMAKLIALVAPWRVSPL